MHLHGHAFDVTQSAGGVENLVNPVRRDVVTMMGGREVRFRFRTDNPGPWFLHCQYVLIKVF
jgi:iron transport multicopper oxidase